jgi:hypothetical protein
MAEIDQDTKKFGGWDIVLILDEKTARCSWSLGRILEVHTNRKDGLVRSVKVKTSSSVFVQPVDKIIFLDEATLEIDHFDCSLSLEIAHYHSRLLMFTLPLTSKIAWLGAVRYIITIELMFAGINLFFT